MSNKATAPDSLYGTDRDYLREQEKTNEILSEIAGEEYVSPGDIPRGKYVIEKRMLDAAQKKNELLQEIADGAGTISGANKLAIDYGTDILSLKKGDTPIDNSGVTLPAYGVSFDPTTGGLTLTKNGTAMSGQTVTIPNYGSPVAVEDSSDMTDHDKIYLYEGTTGATYTNGHFYYWGGEAWADGGEYAAATVQTDKTLLVEDRAADAKATGEAVTDLKTHLTGANQGKQYIEGAFSYGVFNSTTYMPQADPRKYNAVTMNAEVLDRKITLQAENGYNFLVYQYDENDNFLTKSANWETSRTIDAGRKFRIWLQETPLDTTAILNLDEIKYKVYFNSEVQDGIDNNEDEINFSKRQIEHIGDGFIMFDTDFEHGTVNSSTGVFEPSYTSYKYQAITPNIITFDKDIVIKAHDGYQFQAFWYNEQDEYVSRMANFGTEYTMPAGRRFRLFIRLNPHTTSANLDLETFQNNVYYNAKIHDEIEAIYRNPLTNLPAYIKNSLAYKPLGPLSKGYILLTCDDGTEGLATYTIPMLLEKGVPATFGLLTTSAVITNATHLETVIDAVENHGCCVAQHGSASWSTYSEKALVDYFDTTAEVFENAGITEIHGAICPGVQGYDDTSVLIQAIAGGRFGAVFSGGTHGEITYGSYNASGPRTNMYAMNRKSAIGFTTAAQYQAAIDDAYENHYILCPFWHDYSVVDDTAKQAIIEGMIDYAKTKGLTFITMKDLPTIT